MIESTRDFAHMIKIWLKENYPQYDHVIRYDPHGDDAMMSTRWSIVTHRDFASITIYVYDGFVRIPFNVSMTELDVRKPKFFTTLKWAITKNMNYALKYYNIQPPTTF